MTTDELIEQTAAAIAPFYDELDFSGCAGVLLHASWGEDLTPSALELREGEVTPTVGRDGYQEELGTPAVPDESASRSVMEPLANTITGVLLRVVVVIGSSFRRGGRSRRRLKRLAAASTWDAAAFIRSFIGLG
jgi:hypothetical protein